MYYTYIHIYGIYRNYIYYIYENIHLGRVLVLVKVNRRTTGRVHPRNLNSSPSFRKTDWDLQFDKIVFNFPESTHEAVSEEETVLDNQYLLAGALWLGYQRSNPHGTVFKVTSINFV